MFTFLFSQVHLVSLVWRQARW